MDILQSENIFTEEDKKFNREMIQQVKHNINENNSSNRAEKSLSRADGYFGCVNDILSDYRKNWGIM